MYKGFSIQEKCLYGSHPYSTRASSSLQKTQNKKNPQQPSKNHTPLIKFQRIMPGSKKSDRSTGYFQSKSVRTENSTGKQKERGGAGNLYGTPIRYKRSDSKQKVKRYVDEYLRKRQTQEPTSEPLEIEDIILKKTKKNK